VMNNIVFRVLPYADYIAWFELHGMPDASRLKEKYAGPTSTDPKEIYPLYTDPEFAGFSTWVAEKGNTVYSRFLLTHPECLFLLHEEARGIRRMLAYNFGYIGTAEGISVLGEDLFPVRPVLVLIVLTVFVYISYRENTRTWILPMVLLIVFAFNSLLLYVADSMEIERHEYITMTMVQFLGVLAFSFFWDTDFGQRFLDRVQHRMEWQFPSEEPTARTR
jgi:hypothetical protein